MNNNIGSNIKTLAKVLLWVGLIICIPTGVIFMAAGYSEGLLVGLIVFIVGCLGTFISSWLMYGFGVLIEKTSEIARNTAKTTEKENLKNMTNEDILNTLVSWKENNLISDEEFEAKKQALIENNRI